MINNIGQLGVCQVRPSREKSPKLAFWWKELPNVLLSYGSYGSHGSLSSYETWGECIAMLLAVKLSLHFTSGILPGINSNMLLIYPISSHGVLLCILNDPKTVPVDFRFCGIIDYILWLFLYANWNHTPEIQFISRGMVYPPRIGSIDPPAAFPRSC